MISYPIWCPISDIIFWPGCVDTCIQWECDLYNEWLKPKFYPRDIVSETRIQETKNSKEPKKPNIVPIDIIHNILPPIFLDMVPETCRNSLSIYRCFIGILTGTGSDGAGQGRCMRLVACCPMPASLPPQPLLPMPAMHVRPSRHAAAYAGRSPGLGLLSKGGHGLGLLRGDSDARAWAMPSHVRASAARADGARPRSRGAPPAAGPGPARSAARAGTCRGTAQAARGEPLWGAQRCWLAAGCWIMDASQPP
jgi:hypothetical protein